LIACCIAGYGNPVYLCFCSFFIQLFEQKYIHVQGTSVDDAIVGLGGNDQRFVNRRVDRICGSSDDESLHSNGKLFDGDSSYHLAGSADDQNNLKSMTSL
jgi:hypothetical protein